MHGVHLCVLESETWMGKVQRVCSMGMTHDERVKPSLCTLTPKVTDGMH